jgi:hypothetical protein
MVAGTAQAVEQMVTWARRGPRPAVVIDMRVFPGEGDFGGFEQRPSA